MPSARSMNNPIGVALTKQQRKGNCEKWCRHGDGGRGNNAAINSITLMGGAVVIVVVVVVVCRFEFECDANANCGEMFGFLVIHSKSISQISVDFFFCFRANLQSQRSLHSIPPPSNGSSRIKRKVNIQYTQKTMCMIGRSCLPASN